METEKTIQEKKHKIKNIKLKKEKNEDNFKLLNVLEFSTLNNTLSNDLFNIKFQKKHKSKKDKSKKDKNNNITTIDNSNNIFDKQENVFNSDDSEYLEKKLVKNNAIIEKKNLILGSNIDKKHENDTKIVNINEKNNNQSTLQYVNSINPLIQNEVIWYSEDLDSTELENKFKNKFNKQNEEINNIKNIEINEYNTYNYKIYTTGNEIDQYFTNNQQLTLRKKCILECKKIESNIFVYDTSCDQNYSFHTSSNNNFGLTYLNNMFFVSDGKKYIPEIVEIYLNENILLKRIYSDVIKNINQFNITEVYNIGYKPFILFTDTKITIKIIDSNQIDSVYFNANFSKLEDCGKNCYTNNEISTEMICLTHELLYEGIDTDIKISTEYGYYEDIYIICENIIDNIKSISLINTDVILFNNIPIQLLEPQTNSITYTLKFDDFYRSGLKVDSNNCICIKLDKINPDKKIKIYGNKLCIINNLPIIEKN